MDNRDNLKRLPGSRTVIAMAGLPGTGKSTIARELGLRLHAVVLNKDEIRAKLFPVDAIDFSREQDDLCMEVLFLAAGYILKEKPEQIVIIDGRTFTKACHIAQLLSHAHKLRAKVQIIECVCDNAVARERIERDRALGSHPAGNRTFQLYESLKARAEPIMVEHLLIDTGKETQEKCVEAIIFGIM